MPRPIMDYTGEPFYFLEPPQAPDEIGRFAGFRVLKWLAEGDWSLVFEAEHLQIRHIVALKILKPELTRNSAAWERFRRMAQAMAGMASDRTVAVHVVGEAGGVPYVALELLRGETLEQRFQREGRLALSEVVRLGREIALGLQAVHARGLVHRDIKPSHIWLPSPTDRVKLLGFFLVRRTDTEVGPAPGMIIGTPSYMAPEQARGQTVNARADLYSLGVVLYRLCTEELPIHAADVSAQLRAVVTEQPLPAWRRNSKIPRDLSNLIQRLLARNPTDRPTSAAEVAKALEEIGQSLTTAASSRSLPRVLVVMALGLLLGVAFVVLILMWQFGGAEP